MLETVILDFDEKKGVDVEKKLAILLSMTLIIGTLISPVFSVTGQSAASRVQAEPTSIEWTEPDHAIGETFSINIVAYDVVDLWGWSTGIKYDPTVISYVGYEWGDFVAAGVEVLQIEGTIDLTTGETTKAWSEAATGGTPVNAPSLRLITFNFEIVGYGTTLIEIMGDPFTKVSNVEGESYTAPEVNLVSSSFSFMPAANVPPVADFTWTPTFPVAGVDTVTFDASASYDPDGVGIANMTFDFGDGTSVTLYAEPWVTTHLYEAEGTYTVTLIVWDKGKLPYYTELSTTTTKDIKVVPPAPPSGVDVFTIKEWLGRTTLYRERGTGPLAAGSAFAPGETVTLRGYVYYEGLPVIATNVGFQVNDPDGLVIQRFGDSPSVRVGHE